MSTHASRPIALLENASFATVFPVAKDQLRQESCRHPALKGYRCSCTLRQLFTYFPSRKINYDGIFHRERLITTGFYYHRNLVVVNSLNSSSVGNFHPSTWDGHFLNFISHNEAIDNVQKEQEVKFEQLKIKLKNELLATANKPLEGLDFIDALERLGVAYHFEREIESIVEQMYKTYNDQKDQDDLYHTSIHFRILRQHGFHVSCDIFNKFKDGKGSFKDSLAEDVVGMLSLYEASHVRVHGDEILDEAFVFSTTHLKSMANQQLASSLAEQVAHALHQPLHKGMPRVESRHYISIYEQEPSHNKTLLKFAKLDFNFLQSLHQKELQDLTRWWKKLHLNASFSRDRIPEVYLWILGTYYEPHLSFARKVFRKLFKATSLLDDTYDSYGTVEELELLTEAFQRWEKSDMDRLPGQTKWCFIAFLEACEEAEEELNKKGRSLYADYYAKQQVKALSHAYLVEAKWCHEKQFPTYDEYMKVALITSPYPLSIVASFLGMEETSEEVLEWACQDDPLPNAIKAASKILRLMNDMGGHKSEHGRDHIPSAVRCLMKQHGMSEEEALLKIRKEVEDAWKDLNQAMLKPYVIPKPLLTRILNLARSVDVIYKGMTDGYTNVSQTMKETIESVLVHPIPM